MSDSEENLSGERPVWERSGRYFARSEAEYTKISDSDWILSGDDSMVNFFRRRRGKPYYFLPASIKIGKKIE